MYMQNGAWGDNKIGNYVEFLSCLGRESSRCTYKSHWVVEYDKNHRIYDS